MMRFSESFSPTREIGFPTDDEENQAESFFPSEEESTESEIATPSRHVSCYDDGDYETILSAWPRSYRESMNIRANMIPSFDLLRGSSLTDISSSVFSLKRRKHTPDRIPPLTQRLLYTNREEGAPSSTINFAARKLSSASTIEPTPSPNPSKKCSFSQALLNGVNVLCGIGLLATPFAVREGGWLGLSLLAIFGCVCCYTGILIQRCLEFSPGVRTYPDIGQAAFGTAGRVTVAMVLYTELYAVSVEFLVMMGDNLASVFPNVTLEIAGLNLGSSQVFAILSALAILPTVWLRDLSLLSYISAGGVFTSLLVVFCLLWVGVVNQVGFHPSGTALDLTKLPVAIGLYAFCYSGHSTFPNLYSSMEKPSKFPTVLVISFVVCWLIYTGVAICAFLMFGNSTESQFTLSMPTEYVATKIAVWTTILSPITKYALIITPVTMGIEELLPDSGESRTVPLLMRTILVLSTLFVALAFRNFALIMALIGSLQGTLITFIFPCACYLSIYRGRVSWVQISLCTFIMILGSCISSYSLIARFVSFRAGNVLELQH